MSEVKAWNNGSLNIDPELNIRRGRQVYASPVFHIQLNLSVYFQYCYAIKCFMASNIAAFYQKIMTKDHDKRDTMLHKRLSRKRHNLLCKI